jgi:hypothetical protein
VYFYETVAQTSHKNINQGIFENILKKYRKKSISHLDVYGANGPKWTFSVIFWNSLKNSLIYIFVKFLSYGLLIIHRKLTSGYLLRDNPSFMSTCGILPNEQQTDCLKINMRISTNWSIHIDYRRLNVYDWSIAIQPMSFVLWRSSCR